MRNLSNTFLCLLLATTNCAYASDLQIFESIKIGDRFENICGTDGKYCHEINPLELTDVWLSTNKFPSNQTYKYSNKNDAPILLRFDSFGFLYVKNINNPDLLEDIKQKGYKLAVKNASIDYLNYGDIWKNDDSLLRIDSRGIYVFDIEGPFKRYTKFRNTKNTQIGIPLNNEIFDANYEGIENVYKFSRCKQRGNRLTCSINNEDLYFAIEIEKPYLSISIFGLKQNINPLIEKIEKQNNNLESIELNGRRTLAVYGNKSLGQIEIGNLMSNGYQFLNIIPCEYFWNKKVWDYVLLNKKNTKQKFLKLN